ILENTISYDKIIGEDHSFSILLGQSAQKTTGRNLGGTSKFLLSEDPDRPNMDFTTGSSANPDERNAWGSAYPAHTISSLFARVSYDYKARYMFQATVRRDGSSRFGSNNHYAIFPSFSLGWNITEESFLENRPSWWNTTKIRYSWGKNGNENIGAFAYMVNTSTGHINNYFFGPEGSAISTGAKASGIPNPAIHWEENIQHDAGIDMDFFNSALSLSVDWYKKTTDGMLQTQPIVTYVGEAKPIGNIGKMENTGWEFDLSYRWNINDIKFRFAANASYLKNKLVDYGTESGENDVESMSAAGFGVIAHCKNGEPYPYFYGYQTAGVFQNMAEVEASGLKYGNEESSKAPKPGDLIFVDQNGDGFINDADNTKIGKGMPDWTFGFSLNVDYKGFDFVAQFQGVLGADVYDATRRNDIKYVNLPAYIKDRWTGEGTSNTVPIFDETAYNKHSSDFFVKDGSYLRLRNIELGYTLPQQLTSKAFISKARVFVSCQNLFTATKYEGFDPEIGQSTTAIGIDKGIYPQARTLTFGCNVSF
ncbi:MAG: SusC/RagA family TonB-linked outer membrane protein, partial [Bacteroidales bacterium]|nr:SusC/RagA family TonB-linked outer membrane protein [Bacteroidales bacterium]